jgi:hypothetical protein
VRNAGDGIANGLFQTEPARCRGELDCHKPALAADFVTAIAIAIRAGWRRIRGVWRCPECAALGRRERESSSCPVTARCRKHASPR